MISRTRFLLLSILTGLLLAASLLASGSYLQAAGGAGIRQPAATDRYVSTGGTNSGGCTAAGTPCRTIQFAVDAANPGDRILVAGGIYNAYTGLVLFAHGSGSSRFSSRNRFVAQQLRGGGLGTLY